jgi:hypothetical protein
MEPKWMFYRKGRDHENDEWKRKHMEDYFQNSERVFFFNLPTVY